MLLAYAASLTDAFSVPRKARRNLEQVTQNWVTVLTNS